MRPQGIELRYRGRPAVVLPPPPPAPAPRRKPGRTSERREHTGAWILAYLARNPWSTVSDMKEATPGPPTSEFVVRQLIRELEALAIIESRDGRRRHPLRRWPGSTLTVQVREYALVRLPAQPKGGVG